MHVREHRFIHPCAGSHLPMTAVDVTTFPRPVGATIDVALFINCFFLDDGGAPLGQKSFKIRTCCVAYFARNAGGYFHRGFYGLFRIKKKLGEVWCISIGYEPQNKNGVYLPPLPAFVAFWGHGITSLCYCYVQVTTKMKRFSPCSPTL